MTALARALTIIALAVLLAGCITPSDPRLDDGDIDEWSSEAGSTLAPTRVEPTAVWLDVPTSIVGAADSADSADSDDSDDSDHAIAMQVTFRAPSIGERRRRPPQPAAAPRDLGRSTAA
jgi:hypothetical protein